MCVSTRFLWIPTKYNSMGNLYQWMPIHTHNILYYKCLYSMEMFTSCFFSELALPDKASHTMSPTPEALLHDKTNPTETIMSELTTDFTTTGNATFPNMNYGAPGINPPREVWVFASAFFNIIISDTYI